MTSVGRRVARGHRRDVPLSFRLANQPSTSPRETSRQRLAVAGLFAGIGGIELGLRRAGHETHMLCELDPSARAVLEARLPELADHDDVRTLKSLPKDIDLLAAGFPCQDLSQAGMTAGI